MEVRENLSYSEQVKKSDLLSSFFMQVYGWMFFGLATTGFVAYYVANNEMLLKMIFGNSMVFYGLLIAQLVLVFVLSGASKSLSPSAASFIFFVYSALNGATLSSIILLYTYESIASVFFITSGTFGAMSAFGYFTKKDLSKMGSILFMALIGLILATLVNIFLQSTALMWILTYVGVLVFVGLTAFDTQKLKQIGSQITDENMLSKIAVIGALTLYLDFVNMFLYMLRIFGNRRN